MRGCWILAVVASCFSAATVAAQEHPLECARLADPAARLGCYDRLFPVPAEVVEAAARRAEESYGLERAAGSLQSGRSELEQLESRVVDVDHGRNGQRTFKLENGQTWVQVEARVGGHVQVGQVVSLRKAILGGYQLVTPAGVALRVRRTH